MSISIANRTVYTNPGNLGTGSFSIPTTTSGNLLVIMSTEYGGVAGFWSPPQYVSTNADSLTQVPFYTLSVFFPNNAAFNMGAFPGAGCSSDVWYGISHGGTNTINFKNSGTPFFWVYELTGSPSWILDDFEGSGARTTSTAPVVGPSINGTASNDIYFSVVASFSGNTTAVSSPWALDATAINGNSPAYILTGTGPQQATFTDSAGNDAFSIAGVSFKTGSVSSIPNTLTGGPFQKPDGTPIAHGTLLLELSHDENYVTGKNQIVAGLKQTIALDANGFILGTPTIWPNDSILPSGSYYTMKLYAQDGSHAWDSPHHLVVASSPSPFNIVSGIDYTR